jgi:phage shock protein A
MGIFTRFRDIISSNINAMLDRAEDPEKMIKLMIREMEDTLVELKASCAGVMADTRKVERRLDETENRTSSWQAKAALAVDRGRDDLAREALQEKRRHGRLAESLRIEVAELHSLIEQYHQDIRQLEDKLKSAREKQRLLVQRHIHARRRIRAQEEIRRVDSSDAVLKFEALENRIDRMETEADLINFGRKNRLEEELDTLTLDEEIENELQALKKPSEGPADAVDRG